MSIESNYSSLKFRKVLNDLKRRPEDAAKDLRITEDDINKILNNQKKLTFELIKKATEVWPVNYSDFFIIEDDTDNGIKIFSKNDSDKTARVMSRGGVPYYLYKDTVMSKISPFRPEWIEEKVIVENSDPNNNQVKFNNGHFLHQFTYFIGPVNFYYIDENNNKKIAEMNTGDSMYISPYIPHSFTTRKNSKNKLGLILALTYTDKVDNDVLNELSAVGETLSKKYKLDLSKPKKGLKSNIENFLKINSMPIKFVEKNINQSINSIINDTLNGNILGLQKLCNFLNTNIRDLLPINEFNYIDIKYNSECKKWFLPDNKNQVYKIIELAGSKQLPYSKALELEVLKKNKSNFIDVPCHQYIYNIGDTECEIDLENKKEILRPGDSCYIKPNKLHCFNTLCKLLILRIGGKVSGDNLFHLSILNERNFYRLLNDNKPWFN